MKKYIIITICAIIAITFLASGLKTQTEYEYLRIHIRANSNLQIDQDIKYEIKDKIVNYLAPYLSSCQNKEQSEKIINSQLDNIKKVADETLKQNDFDYTSSAQIKNEFFPTRVYDGVVFESGNYDALIINLGSGDGDNWWCVVYPPLCFVSANTKIVYKSKIVEIVNNWKKENL